MNPDDALLIYLTGINVLMVVPRSTSRVSVFHIRSLSSSWYSQTPTKWGRSVSIDVEQLTDTDDTADCLSSDSFDSISSVGLTCEILADTVTVSNVFDEDVRTEIYQQNRDGESKEKLSHADGIDTRCGISGPESNIFCINIYTHCYEREGRSRNYGTKNRR